MLTSFKSRFIEMFDKYKGETIPLKEVCKKISAGGDKPDLVSDVQNEECPYPIYSNGEKNAGLYGFSNNYTISERSVTISARGTIGYTAIREPNYTPIIRLITLIPNDDLNCTYLKAALDGMISGSAGSSIQQLTVPNVERIRISKAPFDEQLKFEKFVQQVDKSKFNELITLSVFVFIYKINKYDKLRLLMC